MLEIRVEQRTLDECRALAQRIASQVQHETSRYTTVSIERTILRLLGVEEADSAEVPLVNRVVDRIGLPQLRRGVLYWVGNLMTGRGLDFRPSVQLLIERGVPADLAEHPRWCEALEPEVKRATERILARKRERDALLERLPAGDLPWFYCIVATGNIHEDVVQAQAAARQGAQVIAVIRSTAQSLLDYVPHGPTTEGYAGTFATQANFRIMRQALDEVGEQLGRYVMLCNYCSGLCMPEIAALGALERLDMMLNDALYGVIFRDINMLRTLTDQFFSRRINGLAGIIINTGEDNYLKTDDGLEAAHTVLASQFVNEQLARLSGVPESQTGIGHAFELDPEIEDGFLYELAQALLVRRAFPRAPLKYMPPTRYKTGDVFQGHLQDGLFNLVSLLSGQHIQLLGMLSEAVGTPGLHDRYLALTNARYIANNCRHLAEELVVREGGRLERRAAEVLGRCCELLEEIASDSLFSALSRGVFAGIPRSREEGRGLEGVVPRDPQYYNPFEESRAG